MPTVAIATALRVVICISEPNDSFGELRRFDDLFNSVVCARFDVMAEDAVHIQGD